MKFMLIAVALCLLPACSQQNVKDLLSNLDKDCVRHYAGSLASGVPASGTVTFQIDCQPSGVNPPPVVNPAAKPNP